MATETGLFRLTTLGPPSLVDQQGRPVPGVSAGKPLAVLCYLALRGVSTRSELVALLWGDTAESAARNACRQSLHRLRTALGDVIPRASDELRLLDSAGLWCDVVEFEAALDSGDTDGALLLYGGHFLDGFDVGVAAFAHWADGERARLAGRLQGALHGAATAALAGGDTTVALRYAERLSDLLPMDAGAAVLYGQVLAAAGRRQEALAGLRGFRQRWVAEMGDRVPAAVADLLARLEHAHPAMAPPFSAAPAAGDVPVGLHGREVELGTLARLWRSVLDGEGRTVVVTGEAGIGKSAVAVEFTARLPALGRFQLLRMQGSSGRSGVPFAEFAAALRPLLRAPGLAGASTHLLAEAARLMPELRDRFALPELAAVEDEAARLRFFEGIAAMVEAVAYEVPVCLLVDDAHLLSAGSLDLARYLEVRLQGCAYLQLVVWPTEAGSCPLLSNGRRTVGPGTELRLGELTAVDALLLAEELLVEAGGAPAEAERVVALGGGHPLRLQEAAVRVSRGDSSAAPLSTVRAVFEARYATSSAGERRVLAAIALLKAPVVRRLAAAAAHLPARAAEEAMDGLVRRGLLREGLDGLELLHDAAGTVALAALSPSGRAMFALWAADALVAEGSPDPAVAATLYAEAGRGAEACRYALMGAAAAAGLGEPEEAASLLRRVLPLAPDETSRSRIENALAALGRPARPRLAAGAGVEPEAETEDAAAPAPAATPAVAAPLRRWQVRGGVIVAAAATVAALVIATVVMSRPAAVPRLTMLQDTLLLGAGVGQASGALFQMTGDLEAPRLVRRGGNERSPEWLERLSLPWMNALAAPDGRWIAVERATGEGTRIYVIDADGRDTITVPIRTGDALNAAWSPDGATLLAIQTGAGSAGFQSGLLAFHIPSRRLAAIDTAGGRLVIHAAWSPAGLQIAWTAREESGRHVLMIRDVGGGQPRVLATDVAEPRTIAWAPYGDFVGIVVEVDGVPQVVAVDVESGERRRITLGNTAVRNPQFSPDGRFLAYDAADAGGTSTFVMAALGGEPWRISRPEDGLTLAGWRGPAPRYLERVRARAPRLAPGARHELVVAGFDQRGEAMSVEALHAASLDEDVAAILPRRGGAGSGQWDVLGRGPGTARIVVSAAGWRADTAHVRVGTDATTLLAEDFAAAPAPALWQMVAWQSAITGPAGLVLPGIGTPAGGLIWRRALPLEFGVGVEATLHSAGGWHDEVESAFALALVVADPAGQVQDMRDVVQVVSLHWLGEAGRLAYSAGREAWTEPLANLGVAANAPLHVRVEIGDDGTATFIVNDSVRWQPDVRIAASTRAQLWVGGRSGRAALTVRDLRVELPRATH
jgi:DNA-binding SARP family transcriptional activator